MCERVHSETTFVCLDPVQMPCRYTDFTWLFSAWYAGMHFGVTDFKILESIALAPPPAWVAALITALEAHTPNASKVWCKWGAL